MSEHLIATWGPGFWPLPGPIPPGAVNSPSTSEDVLVDARTVDENYLIGILERQI